ncbi:hypothetical protein [Gottfriedia solisilvae]|uniref:Uncharacterized protein n=1 Tax=Gottfriedia solisilvae TaxID=1516104 RepID=A0A8J3F131_9BACI|nr:hypothetical protein [Gottfriedia solisilvae]GGI12921.1 hypothetical protein GCM10007380_15330 [Gottfriedia solisilvae]
MIQKEIGNITTSLGIINSNLKVDEFKKTELFNNVGGFIDHDNGHKNYTIKNVKIDKHSFIIKLYFLNDRLKLTSLVYVSEKNNEELSWSDWSLEKELKRKEFHDNLITKWLGRRNLKSNNYVVFKYKWGSVSSAYDIKSQSSSICINYL